MATYTVTNKYLIDDFAVLQLLTPTELEVGQSITVAAVDATFNGTYTVRALPQYLFEGVDTEGGYVDSLTTVPSQDVKLGTIMYGGALYRQRGSMDSFASFQSMGTAPVMGLNGMIRQLLGIDRPQVA